MSINNKITTVTDGLVFAVDALNRKSSVSGSTDINSLIDTITGETINGVVVDGSTWDFDGVNDYIYFGNTPTIPITYPLTMCSWINPNWDGIQTDTIITIGNTTNENITLNCGWNTRKLRLYLGGNISPVIADTDLDNDVWSYVSCTAESNGDVRLYVNGELDGSADGGVNPTGVTTTLRFGQQGNTLYKYNGKISRVGVYNRALTATEVLQNYNATKHRFK